MTRRLLAAAAMALAVAAVSSSGAAGPAKTPAGPPVVQLPAGAVVGIDCVVTRTRWLRCRLPTVGRPGVVLLRAWEDGSVVARPVRPR